jgi:hypothetical protein
LKIVQEYQRREFCKDWGCSTQERINKQTDQIAIDAIKEESCKNCMAHIFHKWLMDRDYQIVIIQ